MPGSASSRTSVELRLVVDGVIDRNFHDIQPAWVEDHLRLLLFLRRKFGNDLDKVIILAVIGQVMFARGEPVGEGYHDILVSQEEYHADHLTNVESIAMATGIPRESVRRKVCELIDQGWVKRDGKRRLLVTNLATIELEEGTRITFRMMSDLYMKIQSLMPNDDRSSVGAQSSADQINKSNLR